MTTKNITIIGLGPGEAKYLTREAWGFLKVIPEIYLRTSEHPVVSDLPPSLEVHSFDHLYERLGTYELVYEEIANQILALGARESGVVYGVPGDPQIAEATTALIQDKARDAGHSVQVFSGMSFIEPVCRALDVDPLPRLTIVDALELAAAHHPPFPPDFPALVPQLFSRSLAAEVKLTLMANYPDLHPATLIHAAGTEEELVEDLALYEIDRSLNINSLTCLYLPPLEERTSMESFQDLIAHLRAPDGCPWDRDQTHLSLRPYLLEETYEALAALDSQDSRSLEEELGDLLIQIVLHTQIATEAGEFNLPGVLQKVSEKLVFRHPHVFGDVVLVDAEAVKQNWERLKTEERKNDDRPKGGSLSGVPDTLPSLSVADAYQKRAARVGFDWPELAGVISKIQEELAEVLDAKEIAELAPEIGDLLFSIVNLARWYDLDAESLLRKTNAKFRYRFERIERKASETNRNIQDLSLDEMDEIWEEAKDISQE